MSNKMNKDEAFNNLYLSYKGDLIRYAFSLTKNAEMAEDLLQDTYSIAWCKLEHIKDINRAKYWLITTMRREFLKGVNKDKFKNTVDFEDMSEILKANVNTEKQLELEETLNHLDNINEKYSKVLILHSIFGYKISEISKVLKIPENTVSTRLARSRVKISEEIKK